LFLTAGNLAHHLITRGLLSCDSIVDGDFAVVEAGRRNRNFKVIRSSGGLFVKQVKFVRPEAIATLHREAAFHQLLQSRKRSDSLMSVIPPLIDYDPATHSLAVELIPDGEDLAEYHVRLREFPESAGELAGRALGIFHSETGPLLREPGVLNVVSREPPWIFTLDPQTLSPLTTMDNPGDQLGAMLRAMPDLLALLVSLRYEWQYNSLIHGDMKWENCVVVPKSGGRPGLCLVDWELVSVGDPSWDVGAIFTSYLLYPIFTAQANAGSSPDRLLAEAQPALQRMRPALAAFWREYVRTRQLNDSLSGYYLVRTIRFCAARLVVAAFEHMFNFGQATAHTFAMLQMARSIFLNPASAAAEMAGNEV
jgi:hypothetical protein